MKKNIINLIILTGIILNILFIIKNSNNQEKNFLKNDAANANINASNNILEKEKFLIKIPFGWEEPGLVLGVSAIIINTNEKFSDPSLQESNFKTYYTVAYEESREKSLDSYLPHYKRVLKETSTNALFVSEKKAMINGKDAYILNAETKENGIDYKAVIAIVKDNNIYWTITFNMVKDDWKKYEKLSYDIIYSFRVK